MLARLLAVVLALGVAPAACGKEAAPAAKVVPGQRAGVVLEASGEVTATRPGAAARAIGKGDVVSGDDVVRTGADGMVLIELDHNHATFTLPAGKTQEVATSLAWSQPAVAARPATTDEHSAAAGRAHERSAVDTSVSRAPEAGAAPGAAAPPPPLAQAAPPPPPKPALDGKSLVRGGKGGKPGEGGGGTTESREEEANNATRDVGDGEAAPPREPAPANTEAAPMAPLAAAPAPAPAPTIAVKGGLTRDEIAAVILRDVNGACASSYPAKGTITIEIGKTGKATRVTASAGGAALVDCVKGALAKHPFPARAKPSTITLAFGGSS